MADPELLTVTFWKALYPVPPIDCVSPLKLTVAVAEVENVPLLIQSPATFNVVVPPMVSVVPGLITMLGRQTLLLYWADKWYRQL